MTTGEPPEQGNLALVEPNFYLLHGDGRTVTLLTSGIDGRPQCSYHDTHVSLNFSGDEITMEKTEMGTLVTVTIQQVPDAGSTSFSVVLPLVNLVGATPAILSTFGITAMHRTTIAGLGRGQLTTYHVSHMHGSASQVQT
jgi:hypothetical protein